ncbi:hypothetical protein D9M70_447200 [compost metagenome]
MTRRAVLDLARMTGNRGVIMRQLAGICESTAERDRIKLSYAISDTDVSVTFDLSDLSTGDVLWCRSGVVASASTSTRNVSASPRRQTPKTGTPWKPRSCWNTRWSSSMWKSDAPAELVRETLAAACERAISMARKHRCGTIVL